MMKRKTIKGKKLRQAAQNTAAQQYSWSKAHTEEEIHRAEQMYSQGFWTKPILVHEHRSNEECNDGYPHYLLKWKGATA